MWKFLKNLAHRVSGTPKRFGHLEVATGYRETGKDKTGIVVKWNTITAWVLLADGSVINIRYPRKARDVSRLDVLRYGYATIGRACGGCE